MGIYLCVCGSTSRVLGVWVIQFSVTLFRKISRDPNEQSSSESSLNFPDPTENRTSGSRFDAQPIVEASYAGPAPLDLGASLLGSWALSRPRSRPTPTPPGISNTSYPCWRYHVCVNMWKTLTQGLVGFGNGGEGGFTHSRRRPPSPERNR